MDSRLPPVLVERIADPGREGQDVKHGEDSHGSATIISTHGRPEYFFSA